MKKTSSTRWPQALNHHFKDGSKHSCPVIYSLDIPVFCKKCQFKKKKKTSRYTLTIINIDLSRLNGCSSLSNFSFSNEQLEMFLDLSPLTWTALCTDLGKQVRSQDTPRALAACETLSHTQPHASRLVWAAFGRLSIYTNSLTVWHHWRLRGRHST